MHSPFVENVGAEDDVVLFVVLPLAPVTQELLDVNNAVLAGVVISQQQRTRLMVGLPDLCAQSTSNQPRQANPGSLFQNPFPLEPIGVATEKICQSNRRLPEQIAVGNKFQLIGNFEQRILIEHRSDLPRAPANCEWDRVKGYVDGKLKRWRSMGSGFSHE